MKKNNLIEFLYLIAGSLLPVLPDWMTGDTSTLQMKYRMKYGQRDFNHLIHQRKIKTLMTYLLICVIFLIGVMISMIGQFFQNTELKIINRPSYGQAVKTVPARVKVTYEDTQIQRNLSLMVRQKQLTDLEKKEVLQEFKFRLGSLILGENKDLQYILKPLKLIERDVSSGITIVWSTDRPEIISEEGEVDLIKAEKGQSVKLKALLTLGEYTDTWSTIVRISPNIAKVDYEQIMNSRLEERLELLNKSLDTKDLILPDSLGDGIHLDWEEAKTLNMASLVILFVFAMAVVYFKRYDQIEKELKETSESIITDLPDFINKLVLLLNAGLVVSTALSKIAEDYEQSGLENSKLAVSHKKKRRYLYEELCEIEKRVRQTNTPMIKELREFSQRSGVRELVRIATIISDNLNKGSSLAEKLESEGELLWMSRKKRAEEKGRIAETKLTFPLVILLIVLIMITIAPALIEM